MSSPSLPAESPPNGTRSSGTRLFLGFLTFVAAFYAVIVVYHLAFPRAAHATETPAFLERCRQICERYGLVPTGRIDQDARAFLEATDHQRLSAPLSEVLADTTHLPEHTQQHPLLGKAAPDFSLLDSSRQRTTLRTLNQDGPVVVVFYYGYLCNHCVAQLFGLNDDRRYFEQLNATIVAISADATDETAQKFARYGAFDFPVLSDPENLTATAYGVYSAATESRPADLQHGTFVVDQNGIVIWANKGYQPFTDNRTLLKLIERASRQPVR